MSNNPVLALYEQVMMQLLTFSSALSLWNARAQGLSAQLERAQAELVTMRGAANVQHAHWQQRAVAAEQAVRQRSWVSSC